MAHGLMSWKQWSLNQWGGNENKKNKKKNKAIWLQQALGEVAHGQNNWGGHGGKEPSMARVQARQLKWAILVFSTNCIVYLNVRS